MQCNVHEISTSDRVMNYLGLVLFIFVCYKLVTICYWQLQNLLYQLNNRLKIIQISYTLYKQRHCFPLTNQAKTISLNSISYSLYSLFLLYILFSFSEESPIAPVPCIEISSHFNTNTGCNCECLLVFRHNNKMCKILR